jgi:glycosyltransferase involved in cell wall biosynthesis
MIRPSGPQRRQTKDLYDIAFVPGVGAIDYWCGVCESVHGIVRELRRPVLVVTDGPHSLARRLLMERRPLAVVPLASEIFQGFRDKGAPGKVASCLQAMGYIIRLVRVFRRHGVRVVYTANPTAILAAIAAKLAGAKLVTAIRGEPQGMAKRPWLMRISDRVAVLSYDMKQRLLGAFEPDQIPGLESRITVIYNGVDLAGMHAPAEQSAAIRTKLGLSKDDVLLLYVAAFRPWKGQLAFIREVVPRIFRQIGNGCKLKIAFVGSATNESDKRYEQECREWASASDCPQALYFAGFHDNVWPWYAAADIGVLASEPQEGMPRCIIEAMASGKPVVSYDVCSARELLEAASAGIVLQQGDAAGMAAAICKLIRDRTRREAMGHNARAFAAKRLDIRAVIQSYEDLFDSLLGGSTTMECLTSAQANCP